MEYNGNEIYATRYMKSLFLFGRRWIGYFRLYLTGVRYFCMRSMVSVSLPPCLRYALHMFTAFETDLLCIWSIMNILAERKFAVPGKITFRITAEHGVNFIEFCDAVVECGF